MAGSSPLARDLPLLGTSRQDVEEWAAACCAAQVHGWFAAGRRAAAGASSYRPPLGQGGRAELAGPAPGGRGPAARDRLRAEDQPHHPRPDRRRPRAGCHDQRPPYVGARTARYDRLHGQVERAAGPRLEA